MKLLKNITILFLTGVLFHLGGTASAQVMPISIESTDSMMLAKPKPILLLLSTDWCKYCQLQKHQLKRNEAFQAQSDDFYYIEFDAESKKQLVFNQQLFKFRPTGTTSGIHELAVALNESEKIVYPTWVLLDSSYDVLLKYRGVMNKKQVTELLIAMKSVQEK